MVQEQDVDVDLNFAPANEGNVEPPLVDIPPTVNVAPVVSKVPTDGGTCRSTRICTQPKPQYITAFIRKTYSFATMVLGTKVLDNVAYGYDQSVALIFMQQLSVKSALREWETMQGQQERRRYTNYIGEIRSPQGKCRSLPRSNELRFSRVTCSLGRSGQGRSRREWSQVEIRSVVM